MLAAVLGAALAFAVAAWKRPAPSQSLTLPGPSARADATSSDIDATAQPDMVDPMADSVEPDARGPDMTAPVPVPAAATQTPELHIEAEPEALRVWANTTVHLRAVVPEGAHWDRFTWHFEDGSDPVSGREVAHTFAESVRDRHVTVEARSAEGPAVVVSRRLPVERLEVVPIDGGVPQADDRLPTPEGPRLLFAGGPLDAAAAQDVATAAARLGAEVVVATGDAASAQLLAEALTREAPLVALLHGPAQLDPASAAPEVALRILRNPDERLTSVVRGDRDTGVLALGDVALLAVDTRTETVAEPELRRLREALQVAGAFSSCLVFSARPLTAVRDGEVIADRAYRIYEHALRHQVRAVISAASGVFFDGRFGGLGVVTVGSVQAPGCPRLAGSETCQPASLTLVDIGPRGKVNVRVAEGPEFRRAVPRQLLPAEVGKVRR